MSKISTYPSADTPLQLSDRLIGTEAIRTPPTSTPLATKNFSLGELLQLFSSNFPAASLQAVLNTGNTATQNITLIGTINATLIKPVNIEDPTGSQGTTFQYLSKGTSSINWVDLPISNLQAVLNTGNTATQNINLVGDITATKIIPGNIQDDTSGVGTTGQILSKTASGVRWINNPTVYTAGLADVLLVGNTATNNIILNGYIKPTDIKDSTDSNGSLNQVLSVGAGGLEWITNSDSTVTSLTVTGNSGPSTLIAGVLNIPTYTLSGLNGQPLSTNLTSLSGLTYSSLGFVKMSALGTFTLDTSTYLTTAVTSVGLTVPSAFNVTPSTITTSGTFAITGAGTASQYVRGDGQLATFPSGGGGGSSVNYYLNGSIAASVATYKQMSNTAIIGAGTDFPLTGNGLIAQFLTDVGNPNRTEIPGGAWNFEMFFSMSSGGGSPKFYVELLKYNGTTFTSIASNSATPETISGGIPIDLYLTSLAVPTTALLVTDRLAIRVYIVDNSGGRTATLHTENSHLCEIITTFSGGVTSLNGLTANTQYLAVGTSGTDFTINSLLDTHTFNLPTASASNRGALSTTDWTNFNTAYTDRLKWDGGATGLVAAIGRTSLGANTVGSNLFILANPSAITFIQINADNSISTLDASTFRIAIGAGTVTGAALTNQIAYFTSNGSNIAGLDTTIYPSLAELANVKGVTSPIQTQIDAVNVNVITITTAVSITTDTTNGTYGQHGRHNKISNGANAINLTVQTTSNADFVASYEKIGTGAITFTAGAGVTLTTLSGTAAMTGVAGSKACLSRNGSIYYLQITNY